MTNWICENCGRYFEQSDSTAMETTTYCSWSCEQSDSSENSEGEYG